MVKVEAGDDMGNLADFIEQFILRKLSGEQENIIVLRRNAIAEEIECAPSQISYVLSTRFTASKGFLVESRRGAGGFIRIARIPLHDVLYEDRYQESDEMQKTDDAEEMLKNLIQYGLVSEREAVIITYFFNHLLQEELSPARRTTIVRSLLKTLADLA